MANNQAEINTTPQVCGFTIAAQRDFILTTEGLDSWVAFTSIDYDDFASISKNVSRHTAPFSLGVLKQKRLSALKFWIEDAIRMNELPHTAAGFTPEILVEYIELYAAYVKEKVASVEFVNGPQFDPNDWVVFETGTEECLSVIQSHNGVPLSYLLRDDTCRPILTVASDRDTKIFWHALFTGTAFTHDNKRVWTYLAQRCNKTPAWSHIKMSQAAKDGRRAWLALSYFYGGTAENARKMVVARAALDTLTWSNESSFKFIDYATQLVDHYETLDRGGQPKTDEEKIIKLLGSMNTSNGFLLTRMEMNCTGVTFANAIVDIYMSIAQIVPLANVKGHKAIVSQIGTNSETSYSTHVNVVEFTASNCYKCLSNDDYKCLPTKVRKLIGFAKANGFNEKQSAFLTDKQQNRNKKRGIPKVSQRSHYGPSQDDTENEIVERAISKIAQYYTKDDAFNGDGAPGAPGAPDASPKSNANTGATFGRQNATGGKRVPG